jgi:hypothetical protein
MAATRWRLIRRFATQEIVPPVEPVSPPKPAPKNFFGAAQSKAEGIPTDKPSPVEKKGFFRQNQPKSLSDILQNEAKYRFCLNFI